MKLTRAVRRVTGRLTTIRLITGQLNGHAKGQLTAERRVTGHLNGREEGQWSAEWP